MTTITIEVPEDLAAKIDELRKRVPDALPQVLELVTCEKGGTPRPSSMRHRVFEEMLDFLASGPSSDQIIAHKVSDHTQERLRELLDKNREEGLTEAENAELDAFEYVDYFMSLLKARARRFIFIKV